MFSPKHSTAAQTSIKDLSCKNELENSNKTISSWADTMKDLLKDSKLPPSIRDPIQSEANKILTMISEFGINVNRNKPKITAYQLAGDLVAIRRRSNRLALDMYLAEYDMRWPQNSIQLGVIVDRVQQACLDRLTIQKLESSSDPLDLKNISLP